MAEALERCTDRLVDVGSKQLKEYCHYTGESRLEFVAEKCFHYIFISSSRRGTISLK